MSNKKFSYYLFSPFLDQSYVIAHFLRKYRPDVEIIGVRMPQERFKHDPPLLQQTITVKDLPDYQETGGVIPAIPTGALSTKFYLENFGPIKLGDITLTKDALQVYDKPSFLCHAENAGVPAPQTWTKPEDINKYPIFFKSAYERGGGPRGIAKDLKQLPDPSARFRYIFQEVIAGQGTYGVAFLADRGKILASHTHFESCSVPKDGGSAVQIENFLDRKLIDYTARLIENFNFSGWGLAEFKFCPKRNDYVAMEINGKFWASCEFAFINNPDFMKLLFDIDSKEKAINRMIFVNRAFARNLYFTVSLIASNLGRCRFRKYPGLSRQILAGSIPRKSRNLIRRIINKQSL